VKLRAPPLQLLLSYPLDGLSVLLWSIAVARHSLKDQCLQWWWSGTAVVYSWWTRPVFACRPRTHAALVWHQVCRGVELRSNELTPEGTQQDFTRQCTLLAGSAAWHCRQTKRIIGKTKVNTSNHRGADNPTRWSGIP